MQRDNVPAGTLQCQSTFDVALRPWGMHLGFNPERGVADADYPLDHFASDLIARDHPGVGLLCSVQDAMTETSGDGQTRRIQSRELRSSR